jgi:hypothetical protein
MDPSRHQEKPGPVELAERISNSLIGLFVTLYSANSDISLYCLQHTVDKISQDPSAWKKMDEAYSMYEEQSNRCRRLWMKLRAASENETSQANGAGTSSVHGIRPSERSHSPLKYQSEIYDEDEPRVDQREDDTPTIVEICQRAEFLPLFQTFFTPNFRPRSLLYPFLLIIFHPFTTHTS